MSGTLLIRTDASPELGHGHVMRCLALAEEWKRFGNSAVFVIPQCPRSIEELVNAHGCDVVSLLEDSGSAEDNRATIEIAMAQNATSVVLDGSQFGIEFQKQIKQAGFVLLLLDDYAKADRYYADLVWNADLPDPKGKYLGIESRTKLLLGPKYALLRREFLDFPIVSRTAPDFAGNMVITMGGSDPENMTSSVIRSLETSGDFRIRAIVGTSNPHINEVRRIASQSGNIDVLTNVTDMPSQMAWADMAVIAAGVTLWELLFMGVPVICWPRYSEDIELVSELARLDAAVALPLKPDATEFASAVTGLATDRSKRQQMSDAGRKLVDGCGAERVVRNLSEIVQARIDSEKARVP